jgi:hypothetical protein
VNSQSPQLLEDGPLTSPVLQEPSSAHQPQSSLLVHWVQITAVRQGSGAGQRLLAKSHVAQTPPAGPDASPVRHCPVDSHQPQPNCDVHDRQL